MKANKILYILIFGESFLNDAVSMIFYETTLKLRNNKDESYSYLTW